MLFFFLDLSILKHQIDLRLHKLSVSLCLVQNHNIATKCNFLCISE